MKASREQVLREVGESLKVFQVEQAVFDGPFHFHPELELTYIEEGSGTRLLGDDVGVFSSGDLCLIGSNLSHVYRSVASAGKKSTARATVIQFSLDEGLGTLTQLPELSFLPALCRRAALGLVFAPAQTAILGPQIRALLGASGWMRLRGLLDVLATLAKLKGRTAASPGYVLTPESTLSESVSRACEIILNRYNAPLSHSQLASAVGLSPSAFSRQFKRTTRLNYSQFLTRVRLGHASRLLQETDRGIAAIAFDSGFENLSNFNRRFRERYGSNPKEYRALVRSNRVSE